jgi:hypothetical protein
MADQKITDLTAVGTPTGTDLVEVVQGGANLKMTLAQLLGMGSVAGSVASLASAGTVASLGAIEVTRASAGLVGLSAEISGDTGPRGQMLADGKLQWGPGDDTFDISAERLSSGNLKVTGNEEVHGDLAVDRIGDAADAVMNLKGDAGENRMLRILTGTSLRWTAGAEETAEGGSDAGSDFEIDAYDDSAVLVGTAMKITRATMDALFGAKLGCVGDLEVNTDKLVVTASTGSLGSLGTLSAALGAWFRSTALGLTATTGHVYIPTCAGVPTGVPATKTGQVAIQFDSTNDDLYVYDGSWIKVALT